ncbi:MAG: phosphoribosylanthranilate isomerase [Roseburia sp.]|nr:phosphoribosylanthranilate isomerase [Roseburia sp.]
MTQIKICGLKTLADVTAVNHYLPDYVGFVFAPTKRFVTDEQALAMKRALDKRIRAVGVFVNEPPAHVAALCRQGIIDMAQLHGEETEAYIRALKEETDTTVINAVKVQSREQVAEQMSQEADYMLFDTYRKGLLGGTGERFSLDVLEEGLRDAIAQGKTLKPYFIAGGLSSDNVAEILGRQTDAVPRCCGVDVSTGVETDGVKDEAKIREFIRLVRGL